MLNLLKTSFPRHHLNDIQGLFVLDFFSYLQQSISFMRQRHGFKMMSDISNLHSGTLF